MEVKLLGPKGVKYVAAVSPMTIGKIDRAHKKPLKDAAVAPYWLVRRVLDKTMANMQKATMTCKLTTEAGDEEMSHRVSLPIFQNIKALKGGDELLLYVEPSLPSSIMPAQSLEQPCRKRPAAAISKLQRRVSAKGPGQPRKKK